MACPSGCANYKPKPQKESEMVAKVLTRDHEGKCRFVAASSVVFKPCERYVGIYRVPEGMAARGMTLGTALAAIRDAGGEYLAGEPLPLKPEPSWKRVYDPALPRSNVQCGHCGAYNKPTSTQCYRCDVFLKGEVPWPSDQFRNPEGE